MATVTILNNNIGPSNVVALTNLMGNLYLHGEGPTNLLRINPTNGTTFSITGNGAISPYMTYSLATYKTRIYAPYNTLKYYDISNGARTITTIQSYTIGSCALDNFLYYFNTSGSNVLRRVNLDTDTVDSTWTMNVPVGFSSSVGYQGFIYGASTTNSPIYKISIANKSYSTFITSVINTITFQTSIPALEIHNNSLYVASQGASQINRYDLDDPTDRTVPFATLGTPIDINPTGITALNNKLYAIGFSSTKIVSMDLPTNTIPADITIDAGNTYTVSSGSIQVSVIDPSNSITNRITYWYATNINNTYINSGFKPSGSASTATRFTISGLTSAVTTIYVIAQNNLGNSSVATASVNVFTVPSRPNSYSASFSFDTGIQVSITDTNNQASNNIYYYYYTFRVGDTAPNQSGNIAVYSNSYVPLSSGSSVSSFFIPNLLRGDYNIYVAAVNPYGANIYTPTIAQVSVICFKEDSRILTNRGYKKIQHLKKGDLVKTFRDGFKAVHRIGKKEIVHVPTEERSKNHLYKCSPSQYPELFEDLVLTGCHSLLVDDFVDDEQIRKTEEALGSANYMTDGKFRLPVCADRRATIYEKQGKHMVYHIALENDDYYMNYGIYANGLLVESTSKRFLDQFHIMET